MSADIFDKSERVDMTGEAVHWDLGSSLSYSEYLRLDQLLIKLPVHFFPDIIDVHIDHIRIGIEIDIPYVECDIGP